MKKNFNLHDWGLFEHKNGKGGIYWAEEFISSKERRVCIALSDSGKVPFEFKYGEKDPNPFLSLWGAYVDDCFEFRGIQLIEQETGMSMDVPLEKPYIQRALLLAQRCYRQISTEDGITAKENLAWAENLSNHETMDLYNDNFSGLQFRESRKTDTRPFGLD